MACAATLKRSLEFDPVHSPSHGSAKRRRCMPVTMSPSTPPSKIQHSSFSNFADAARKLTTEELTASIAQEMKRLHRRRQLNHASLSSVQGASPPMSSPEKEDCSYPGSPSKSPLVTQSLASLIGTSSKKEVPLFTFKQVSTICERLVREREEEVKEQYDKVLNCKLAEQYEAFLKFNHDQLHRRFGSSEMSYVS